MDGDTKIKITRYLNATHTKFTNRRVLVEECGDDIGICFKILTDKPDAAIPSARHRVVKGKIKITTIRISKVAAVALYAALQRQLFDKQDL